MSNYTDAKNSDKLLIIMTSSKYLINLSIYIDKMLFRCHKTALQRERHILVRISSSYRDDCYGNSVDCYRRASLTEMTAELETNDELRRKYSGFKIS